MAVFPGFSNIGKVPELRRRVAFTLIVLAIYRVGVFISTPGVDRNVMRGVMRRSREPLDLRARHHAVHLRQHHHAAPGHGE
jgi:preprotein translocase subunit SecY